MLKRTGMAAAAALAASSPASGFGVRSHLWIADEIYRDLADCRLTIRGEAFEVPRETCDAILSSRGAFLAGSIGPDAFPDLVVGQSIVHPGEEDGWQANQWIEHLLVNAGPCPERLGSEGYAPGCAETAFARGYALHFAGDSFAHTYVNNYAGEAWDFRSSGRGDERRHFMLEKYIDQFLDYEADPAVLDVPARFLARQLIQFDYRTSQPLGDDYFLGLEQDPEGAIDAAMRRMTGLGTTSHMAIMLAAREVAIAARARAPAVLADATDEVEDTLAAVETLEVALGLPPSGGVPIDRRNAAFRRLSRTDKERLRGRHSAYQSAVDEQRVATAMVVFTREWEREVQLVMEHYIAASLEFAGGMARENATPPRPYHERTSMLAPYRRWLHCYADVLRGLPLEAGTAICARRDRMGGGLSFSDAVLRAGMGTRVRRLYYGLLQLERRIADRLARAAIRIASVFDGASAQLLREITDPARVDGEALNRAFRESGHGRIWFACAVDWIDSDLGLRPKLESGENRECDQAPRTRIMIDPTQFLPLDYALTLAKLSVLDEAGIRQVAVRFGGGAAQMRLTSRRNYSLLVDTVRSIDGNHQWQPISMPYPRREPYSGDAPRRSAGYPVQGFPQSYFGFPFYQSTALRETVFTQLFPAPFEGSILKRPEMRPPDYPYWPCPGDPLRGPLPEGARPIDSCPD